MNAPQNFTVTVSVSGDEVQINVAGQISCSAAETLANRLVQLATAIRTTSRQALETA